MLSGGEAAEDDSLSVRLLRDIRAVFDQHKTDRLASATLVHDLNAMEDRPDYGGNGKPLDPRRLAAQLRKYKIHPNTVRFDDDTTVKGYKYEQFEDACRRYAPLVRMDERHNVTTLYLTPENAPKATVTDGLRDGCETGEKPCPDAACDGVTDELGSHETTDADRAQRVDYVPESQEVLLDYVGRIGLCDASSDEPTPRTQPGANGALPADRRGENGRCPTHLTPLLLESGGSYSCPRCG